MNKEIKASGVTFLLLLLTILLSTVLLTTTYSLPIEIEKFRFFFLTNYYVQQYLFWVAVACSALVFLAILFLFFYPKTIRTFLLKQGDGKLTIGKKAIESMIRSYIRENDFIQSSKINVRATKNKISVNVKGKFKTVSSLISKTETFMQETDKEIKNILKTDKHIAVSVTYTGFYHPENKNHNAQTRVE